MDRLLWIYPKPEEVELETIIKVLSKEVESFYLEDARVNDVFIVDLSEVYFQRKKKEKLPPRYHCCGERTHFKKDCFHKNKYCNKCNQKDHLEVMCKNPIALVKENKKTLEEHQGTLRTVAESIKKYDLQVNQQKYELFRNSVTYLGQATNEKGMMPSPDKVQGVLDMKQPTNKKELRRFIGLVNYFSNHIKDLAELLVPLTPLTSKKVNLFGRKCNPKLLKKLRKLLQTLRIYHFQMLINLLFYTLMLQT